jgi:quercetin dioxygenase-like cupin family protein
MLQKCFETFGIRRNRDCRRRHSAIYGSINFLKPLPLIQKGLFSKGHENAQLKTSYQPSKINRVQRRLYRKERVFSNEQSSVTLFALNKGQSRDLHIDPYDEAVLALEGTAEITISDKVFTLNPSDFIITPKGEPHSLKAITNFKMALLRPQHKH